MSNLRVLIGTKRISCNVDYNFIEKLNHNGLSGEMYKKDILSKKTLKG